MRRIFASAVERGLLLHPGRRQAAKLTVLLPLVVFGVGIARMADGIELGRPVGLLMLFQIITIAGLFAIVLTTPRHTRAGQKLLRQTGRHPRPGQQMLESYGVGGGPVSAAVLGVALLGPAGVTDTTLRFALYGSRTSSSGGYDGSSCGGGSCGGGCGG